MHRETTIYMLIGKLIRDLRSMMIDFSKIDRINFLSRRRDDIEKI